MIRKILALMFVAALPALATAEPDPQFMRGAIPTPQHVLDAAPEFRTPGSFAAPTSIFYVPQKIHVWGNNRYGVCVTSEEAFAKACYVPEIYIDEETVISWARRHGVLNGASLTGVLDDFQTDGFQVGRQRYNDGPYQRVNYRDQAMLRAALIQGPVKIAMAANALPRGAGNQQGWHKFGGGRYGDSDHCVSVAGYGTAGECYAALKVPPPADVDAAKPDCYLLFTWGTIGVVDHKWLTGCTTEAWVRNPTTVGVPPLPPPDPTPDPTPTPTPDTGRSYAGVVAVVGVLVLLGAVVLVVIFVRRPATPSGD